MNTSKNRKTDNEDIATLVDEVMRGERMILFPLGTLISSFFVPTLCIGAVPLSFTLSACQFPLQNGVQNHQGLISLFIPLMIALVIVACGAIGFILIIRGRQEFRSRLLWYVRGLVFSALIFTIFALAKLIQVPLAMCIISIMALAACHSILHSWSFLCFSSFYSLKREYRENMRRAQEKVLNKAK